MDGPGRTALFQRGADLPQRKPGRRLRRLAKETAAVTPVVGTIMILAISAFGLGIVLAWGLPSLEQTQANAELDSVIEQYYSLEEILENVMRSGATGKASAGALSFSDGDLRRTTGTLMLVNVHLVQENLGEDMHRYRASVLDNNGDTITIEIEAINGAATNKRYVDAFSIDPDTEKLLTSENFDTGASAILEIEKAAIGDGTLRVRVMHEAEHGIGEPEDFAIMESWALPLGALEYTRATNFAVTSVYLEMGSVITEYESGLHVHTDPLTRRETTSDGDTRFISLFAPTMTGGPHNAPLEASGAGSHSIRFLLALNMLQVPGAEVREIDLHLWGPRADTWYEYFEDRQGFTLSPDSQPGTIERAILVNPHDPGDPGDIPRSFEFVLMESRVHLEMQRGITRLS
jgi:hypothetical protein